MFSLHLCCQAWYRTVRANKVAVCLSAAAFMPCISRVPLYNSVQTISITCSANSHIDRDNSFKKYPRRSEREEYRRGSSVFYAGAATIRAKDNKTLAADKLSVARTKESRITLPSKPLSADGWSSLKAEYKEGGSFEDHVFYQMIKANTDLRIAKSFLSYLAVRDGDVPYNLLTKYLVLCVQQKNTGEVYDMYDIMKNKFDVLEMGVHTLLIRGLSGTDRWRDAITSLESLKKFETPSAGIYGECIKGAIQHGDVQLAWMLYDEMLQRDLTPHNDVIQSLFAAHHDLQDGAYRKRLFNVLKYLKENQIYPGQPLMESLKSWFERIPDETWKGQLTKVTDNGRCLACKEQLESIHLTSEEYNTLKKEVIDSILKGKDVFRKTTPEELQSFLKFVDSHPPYDIVVDGLNIAYLSRRYPLSATLLSVVSSLAARGKRILVLGRKHMLLNSRKWVKQDIHRLQECADCFFLDNISFDDPYLLYACLSSGRHCCFITSDLLRDHKACLPNTETQRLFFKWQRGHQLVIPFFSPRNIHLQPILSYDTILQNTEVSWHIPYDEMGIKRAAHEVPNTWLCLKKMS